ncbi:ABC transporter ATP-binding protein [Pararhodospirillum oryzae]|uniref:ABC transporter ATP-binding protein n=1 Tax=Pararhodospirillum oryzae TaxID=478448 RepID=A0A512H8E8_9PROT|nr:ABC transporter ATP-binding protein [Pararhodospirillum oryzae]GEO81723.1 ABC transporter ATP-binding protein [Pararhodospirillum oryzae]
MTALMTIKGLRKTRKSEDSLFSVVVPDLEVRPGDRLALVGESGCGKSTLIGLLALAMRPSSGQVFAVAGPDGARVLDVLEAWKRGQDDRLTAWRCALFGYVQQVGGLLPFLSVRQNLALPQALAGRKDPALLNELAARLGIQALLDRFPETLSVGQRQRVSVARALAHRPALILADEPTAALDRANAQEVMRLLVDQAIERRIALILATHDPALSASFGFETVEARCLPGGQTSFSRPLPSSDGGDA